MDENATNDLGGIADDPAPEQITDPGEESQSGNGADSGSSITETKPAGQSDQPKVEDWELAIPEDFQIPEDNLKSFVEAAKKSGLTKEQAAAMLDWHKGFHVEVQNFMVQEQAKTIKNWRDAMAKDPEFGGSNFKGTVAAARRALAEFDEDGSVRKLLRETGQQENPAIIKIIARVGRAMGEHKFIGGNGDSSKKPLHERMYPTMKTTWEG